MALWASTYACEGVIAYTWVNQGMYTAGGTITYELDFNRDFIMDLLFESTGMWFDVAAQNGENLVIAGGGDVHALPAGYLIGPDVDPTSWQIDPLGITLNSSATVPPGVVISTGEFLETTAYMGVQFYIDDLVHYGWVRISNPYPVTGGIIMDIAYETEPGVGIIAGAGVIPEPATTTLLFTGLMALIIGSIKQKAEQGVPPLRAASGARVNADVGHTRKI